MLFRHADHTLAIDMIHVDICRCECTPCHDVIILMSKHPTNAWYLQHMIKVIFYEKQILINISSILH